MLRIFSGTVQVVDTAGAISALVGSAQIRRTFVFGPEFVCNDIVLPDCQALLLPILNMFYDQ